MNKQVDGDDVEADDSSDDDFENTFGSHNSKGQRL